MPTQLILVDDDPMVRTGLRFMLESADSRWVGRTHTQETPAGTFRWVLTEVDEDGKLRDLRSADYEFATFVGALDEGVDQLNCMSRNSLNAGPRACEPISDAAAVQESGL